MIVLSTSSKKARTVHLGERHFYVQRRKRGRHDLCIFGSWFLQNVKKTFKLGSSKIFDFWRQKNFLFFFFFWIPPGISVNLMLTILVQMRSYFENNANCGNRQRIANSDFLPSRVVLDTPERASYRFLFRCRTFFAVLFFSWKVSGFWPRRLGSKIEPVCGTFMGKLLDFEEKSLGLGKRVLSFTPSPSLPLQHWDDLYMSSYLWLLRPYQWLTQH